jgi:hypothetical protein
MGAWRTKNGNIASLWHSSLTKRGTAAKGGKYYRWSSKNGGQWRKMNRAQSLNVFAKAGRLEGGYFLNRPAAGTKLVDITHATLQNKLGDIQEGRIGNMQTNRRKYNPYPGSVQM